MHILVLSDFFPPQYNAGAENIAYEISMNYVKKEQNVSVISINKLIKKGELISEKKGLITHYQIGLSYNEKFSSYIGAFNPITLKIIKKIILKNNFQVAHIHNIHKYISYSVIGLLKKHSIPAILTAHDAMSICYGKFDQGVFNGNTSLDARVDYKVNHLKMFLKYWKRYNLFRNLIIRNQFKKLQKIVCVSKELELLLNVNGIHNTTVINNGVSAPEKPSPLQVDNFKNKLGIKPQDKILLFAGRISIAKGLHQIESLLERVISINQNIKLLIVGKELNLNKKINSNIINTGWVNKDEMNLAYSISHLTLVPSIYLDPFPTVVLESMSKGIPVIASVYSGAREAIINEHTGYLVNPFNTNDFAIKTLKILEDEDKYCYMSNNSKREYKNSFTIVDCTNKYLDLLNKMND